MTTPVPTPLPAFIATGRVRGKSLVIGSDTAADVDTKPDAYYPQGSILIFQLSVPYLIYAGISEHLTAYVNFFTAKINATGDPVTQDGDLLELPATIDQDFINDGPVFWICTPTINGREYAPFRLDIAAGADNYLTDQQVLPPGVGDVQRGPRGAGIVSVDVDDDGSFLFGMSDGSTLTNDALGAFLAGSYVSQADAPDQIADRESDIGAAVSTTAQRASAVINIAERGAVADLATDNWAIIQQAIIDAAAAGPGSKVVIPDMGTGLLFGVAKPVVGRSWVEIECQGPKSGIQMNTGSGNSSFNANTPFMMGTYGGNGTGGDVNAEKAYYLAADPVAGARTLTLATGGGANFAVGDLLAIASTAVNALFNPWNSLVTEVLGISGDVLTIRHALPDSYPTSTLAVTTTASTDVLTFTSVPHTRVVGDTLTLTILTGSAGLASATTYYVKSVIDANNLTLAATLGGATIDITSNGTATCALPGRVYRINQDPALADGGPVGIDGNRAFMVRGMQLTGGGTFAVSAWAQSQEAKGQSVHFSCYESFFDYVAVGGTSGSGNPVVRCGTKQRPCRISGKYRFAALELGYMSCNNHIFVEGDRFGASRATTNRCFAVETNGEGVTDNSITLGVINHYDDISVYPVVFDAGVRNKISGGIVNGSNGGAGALYVVGFTETARDPIIEGVTVPSPPLSGFGSNLASTGGMFVGNRVLKAGSAAAFLIPSGSTAMCVDNWTSATSANDTISDLNTIRNNHRGNRLKTSLPKVWLTTAGSTFHGTSKTVKASYLVPAGSLAESGMFHIRACGTITSGSTNGTKTVTLEIGSLTLANLAFLAADNGVFWQIDVYVWSRIVSGVSSIGYAGTTSKAVGGTMSSIQGDAAVDTLSSDQTFSLNFTVANATDGMSRRLWLVEPMFDQTTGPSIG